MPRTCLLNKRRAHENERRIIAAQTTRNLVVAVVALDWRGLQCACDKRVCVEYLGARVDRHCAREVCTSCKASE